MPIRYPVPAGTVLLCNYDNGFKVPEMVKRRPAVVVSPRLPHRNNLCTVVPLSQKEPAHGVRYQCEIRLDRPLPEPFAHDVFWAKADMLATVAFHRLDLFRTKRDRRGRRKYLHPKVGDHNLRKIRAAILHALGMGNLTEWL